MTTERRDDGDTEFGGWLRNNKNLESRNGYAGHNLDYIWYAFNEDWFILIEEKRKNAKQTFSQKETHKILDQILLNGCDVPVNTSYGKKKIEYRGYYLIQFEKTNPEDSKWIKINGKLYSKADLLRLLKFGILFNLKYVYDTSIPKTYEIIKRKYGTEIPFGYIGEF